MPKANDLVALQRSGTETGAFVLDEVTGDSKKWTFKVAMVNISLPI
jgi:hypothetical protein